MRSAVLVGIKHCGKSTLGRLLADRLSRPFIDSDEELEKTYFLQTGRRLTVREIFRALGEESFRTLEAATVGSLVSAEPEVIALGGGAVSNPRLTEKDLKALGTIVWLDVPDETAYRRIAAEGLPPFLADAPDPRRRFAEINAQRKLRFARLADVTFKMDRELAPDEAADSLAAILEEYRS
ncbi:MAG: shikimate kinase [Lentisphaeria bacterium]|nr:shikimate kinase [Lentisphaeria bacterium]